ncbi:MAG: pentapeptide repeat-containing protein [Geitlerinemataceae cyanobacterium]
MIHFRPLAVAIAAIAAFQTPGAAAPTGSVLGKTLSNDFAAFDRGETNICQQCDFRDYRFPPEPIDEPGFYHNSRLRGSIFQGASLSGVDLTGAYFTCADLNGADLSETNLTNTDFIYADLRGADLSGANLSNATFRGALLDEDTILTDVTINDNTIAPNSNFALRNRAPMTDVAPIAFDNRRNCPGRGR